MNDAELAEVVSDIADALTVDGRQERSAWLRVREAELRSGDPEICAQAKADLAGVVHGMGGLIDMFYGSQTPRVLVLIDRLWAAVKDR